MVGKLRDMEYIENFVILNAINQIFSQIPTFIHGRRENITFFKV